MMGIVRCFECVIFVWYGWFGVFCFFFGVVFIVVVCDVFCS